MKIGLLSELDVTSLKATQASQPSQPHTLSARHSVAFPMSTATLAAQKFFGLLELDAAGTVLFSRLEYGSDRRGGGATDLTGRNFFREVAPFQNVEEFQRCLEIFSRSSQQTDAFNFTCDYEDGPVEVRVLLVRIRARSEDNPAKSILIDIRKAR